MDAQTVGGVPTRTSLIAVPSTDLRRVPSRPSRDVLSSAHPIVIHGRPQGWRRGPAEGTRLAPFLVFVLILATAGLGL
jgi:hypothetical protein